MSSSMSAIIGAIAGYWRTSKSGLDNIEILGAAQNIWNGARARYR